MVSLLIGFRTVIFAAVAFLLRRQGGIKGLTALLPRPRAQFDRGAEIIGLAGLGGIGSQFRMVDRIDAIHAAGDDESTGVLTRIISCQRRGSSGSEDEDCGKSHLDQHCRVSWFDDALYCASLSQ